MFQARVLVVNAVNPEPGVLTHAHYLAEQSTAVARGLELAMKTVMPSEVILAKLAGSPGGLPQAREVEVQPRHPAGMAPLVVKAATGLENPADVCLLSTPYLHDLGRAAETGLPVPRTLITVGSLNYSALIGTPVRRVLEAADIEPAAGDRVILGGVFTGQAAYTLEAGVDRDTLGLSVVADGAYPPVEDNPCLHCGECVRRCPSRIRPGLLSRFAEFDLLDRAREWGIEACMECGLCGYHCPGRRPVLQYIRKGKLALAARECSGEADNSQST
jgi:electron transport complex protein RnfC